MENESNTRREFIVKSSAALAGISVGLNAFSSVQTARIFGANDKIRMGFIGIGNRGSQLLEMFMGNPDVEVAALCDIYEPYLQRDRSKVNKRFLDIMPGQIPEMKEKFEKEPKRYTDFRQLLDDKTIDAVCIATPDHWHALQTISTIGAGKDVYVEKPLTATIHEGRKMIEAQAASKQVVTVGLNRRGCVTYQKLSEIMKSGKLGKVSVARAARINNMFPGGIGRLKPEAPPAGLNWDMWLGPRASRPYQYNIAPYMFRWWSDFSSQMGNWGVHYMDAIRWMLGETAPVAISAHGGKYAVDDDRDIPDTMQVTYEFKSGLIISFAVYEGSGGGLFPYGEIELRGTRGTVYADENGYKIQPTSKGQFQNWNKMIEADEFKVDKEKMANSMSSNSAGNLIRNFLDCVKSRQTPICTLEEGHRSTSFAHLANIALATRQRLEWDAVSERFTNNKEANYLLHYEYRKPWKL